MADPAVTVVIVTYESEDTIEAALAAGKAAYDSGLARYVVVDNDSTDGTVALVRERHPWVTLIENGTNVGFARGCNVGARDAPTPYVLLLNPDAAMELDATETLVKFMDEHPRAAITAPAVIRGNGEFQNAGGLPTPWRVLKAAAGFSAFPERTPIEPGSKPFQTDWVCGAVLMARQEVWHELDGFDPRFFLYFDETDLCRRVLDRGLEIWAVGKAVARHASNASARKVQPELSTGGCLVDHYYPSRFYYIVKHHGWLAGLVAEAGELALVASRDFIRKLVRGASKRGLSARLRAPIFRFPAKVARVSSASRNRAPTASR